ncbi:MAG: MBL fold metallo-hydrolase [Rectinemataceae bacterium]
MEVKILGTGGFENDGLPFNAFLIDGHVLVETPPDILQSLKRENVPLDVIDTIIITHFHGDHCFGLPFLLFNLYLLRGGEAVKPLLLMAPQGIQAALKSLLSLAISPDHPYLAWSLSALDIVEMDEERRVKAAGGLWFEFFRADHTPLTYSIIAGTDDEPDPVFIATSDTRWGDRLAALLARGGRLVLCDSGDGNVHLGPEDIETRVMPLLAPGSRLVATHYKEEPKRDGKILFASNGDIYRI